MIRLCGRAELEQREAELLAPYATHSAASTGRLHEQPLHRYRTAFQRDRDRIVHSRAFRRLEYKTQVFVHHEGDHYRNRLTHSLEGSQIARTVARALRANEDLAEAVALAHDLGHTPFGHAGERVLADLMRGRGGFDHNRQSLRVVDLLERRYAEFPGLNLSAETREGILKHGVHWEHPVPLPPLGAQRHLEAQIADAADEIAYLNHDLDDGLQSGLLVPEELEELSLWREAAAERAKAPSPRVARAQAIVRLIDRLVTDLLGATVARLEAGRVATPAQLREAAAPVVALSPEVEAEKSLLKRFLRERFYQHPSVLRETRRAEGVMGDLFRAYEADPDALPAGLRARIPIEGVARAVADYVAGMTDRFAQSEARRLGRETGPEPSDGPR